MACGNPSTITITIAITTTPVVQANRPTANLAPNAASTPSPSPLFNLTYCNAADGL